jgi:Co/Zn/Cd efflux system component
MILFEVIKILGAMVIIAFLMVLLLAILVSGWRKIFKNEQKNQEEES